MAEPAKNIRGIDRLIAVMARLRDPNRGCPWDIEQTFTTIAPYTIEEAYEVAEAIREGDMEELSEELGDLLLQVVYHARMAQEKGAFDFETVAGQVADKMIRRHPHVFGEDSIESADAQTRNWEQHKAAERERKATRTGRVPSSLDGVALSLPALMRAEKFQKRAARQGFDWPKADSVIEKVEEELDEVRAELPDSDPDRLHEEVGDVLFTVANLARKLGVDPEVALRDTNAKFERRFRGMEARLKASDRTPCDADLSELEAHWQAVKQDERYVDGEEPDDS